jgi:lambda family phage tail tape measure protein
VNQDIKYKILASVVGTQAVEGLKKTVDSTAKSAQDVNSKFGAAATAVKGFAAAFAVGAAVNYVRSIINLGDELDALSQKTGIAANQLYGFKVAASTANLDLGQLEGGLKKFTQNLGSIATGNKEVQAALSSVGVAARDQSGNLRSSGDVLIDLAGKFESFSDGPEKARLAVALFGKSGADFIPFLNQGADALKEFSNVFSEDFAARSDAFNDSITLLGTKFQVLAINAADTLLPTLQEVTNAFMTLPVGSEDVVGAFDIIGEAIRVVALVFKGFVDAFIIGVDTIVTAARVEFEYLAALFGDLVDNFKTRAAQLKAIGTLEFEEAGKLGDEFARRSDERDKKFTADAEKRYDDLFSRTQKRTQEFIKFQQAISKNSLLLGEGTVDEIKKRQRENTAPARRRTTGTAPDISGIGSASGAEKETEAVKKFLEVQRQQIEQEKIKLQQYRLTKLEYDKLIEAKQIDIEVSKASANFSEDGKRRYLEAAEAIKAERMALIDLQQAQRESFTVGAVDALTDYVDAAKDVAGQTKKLFMDAFQGLENAIAKFATTGKLEFRELANSIIEDLIRITIRKGITGPLAEGLGSIFSGAFGGGGAGFSFSGATAAVPLANGGIMTSFGQLPLSKYASGGVARSPQVAIFGEGRVPEAFVPLPDGRNIPVKMEGGGSGAGDTFNISISVQDGGQQQSSGSATPKGSELAKVISGAVQDEIIKQKRPGGLLA